MNTFGTLFRFTGFGESHGAAIGGVVDGMPAGFAVDFEAIDAQLVRRRPGSGLSSHRREADKVRFLSGIFEGRTLGTPIAFIIENTDSRPADYEQLRNTYRPGHADYTYDAKYGVRDYRGGGRASARETAARVVAGALAAQVLAARGISIRATLLELGGLDASRTEDIERIMNDVRRQGDTIGCLIGCTVSGVPAGLGEPVFGKLQAMLSAAMMSINAAKGFDYGDGFAAASMRGSESVDVFYADEGRVRTRTNHSGGIQGGISNGEEIRFRVAFKPIATMSRPLETITDSHESTVLTMGGRHDICVYPRVIPIVEAMTAMTLLDALMIADRRR